MFIPTFDYLKWKRSWWHQCLPKWPKAVQRYGRQRLAGVVLDFPKPGQFSRSSEYSKPSWVIWRYALYWVRVLVCEFRNIVLQLALHSLRQKSILSEVLPPPYQRCFLVTHAISVPRPMWILNKIHGNLWIFLPSVLWMQLELCSSHVQRPLKGWGYCVQPIFFRRLLNPLEGWKLELLVFGQKWEVLIFCLP